MTTAAPIRRWTDLAACRGREDVMFPAAADDETQAAPAKALCRRCPARPECLNEVMRVEDGDGRNKRHGIAGGLGPVERWKRDRVRIDPIPRIPAKCGTPDGAAKHRRNHEPPCSTCREAEQHPQNPQE